MTASARKRVNSNRKGKTGERELARVLTALGYPAERGQQRKGGEDSPDVICPSLKAWHIECKVTASCQMFSTATLEKWMAQARKDAGGKRAPIVIHRWNRAGHWWVLVMPYAQPWYWQRLDKFLQVQHYLPKMWEVPK